MLDFPGTYVTINLDELSVEPAIDFAKTVQRGVYASLKSVAKTEDGDELVFFEIQPEIGQKPVIDIRYKEPIVVHFDRNNQKMPWVYALREDFPLVVHLNLMPFELPRSLCLYEIPYGELKSSWTGNNFLERIREWLSITANDELHQEEQALEPFFLMTSGQVVLPENIQLEDDLVVINRSDDDRELNLVAGKRIGDEETHFVAIPIRTNEQLHGYFKKTPTNLLELSSRLMDLGVDLVDEVLKPKLKDLDIAQVPTYREKLFILILEVPKKRAPELNEVEVDTTSFVIDCSILDLALQLNILVQLEGMYASPIPEIATDEKAVEKIGLIPLKTYFYLVPEKAAKYNGIELFDDQIGLIGVGALGSQILSILNRQGFGKWRFIDPDVLLPHNLSRHYLGANYLMLKKCDAMVFEMNLLFLGQERNKGKSIDYLHIEKKGQIYELFKDVKVIIDTSTSIEVARKLAFEESNIPRMSVFLSPSGRDLVLLKEPFDRSIRLDHVEMQYYRFLWRAGGLDGHLQIDGKPIRYSTSCRDITSTISQEDIITHAGICSKAIRQELSNNDGSVRIWQKPALGGINETTLALNKTKTVEQNGWKVIIDEFIEKELQTLRASRLPNETGGVLIGSYDQVEKCIYIVDMIPSPPDSKEFPHAYYRGIEGVEEQLSRLSIFTANNLQYIGEWHSHPDNTSVDMSDDDKILFGWIKNHLDDLSLPSLMVIVGDKEQIGIYVE